MNAEFVFFERRRPTSSLKVRIDEWRNFRRFTIQLRIHWCIALMIVADASKIYLSSTSLNFLLKIRNQITNLWMWKKIKQQIKTFVWHRMFAEAPYPHHRDVHIRLIVYYLGTTRFKRHDPMGNGHHISIASYFNLTLLVSCAFILMINRPIIDSLPESWMHWKKSLRKFDFWTLDTKGPKIGKKNLLNLHF